MKQNIICSTEPGCTVGQAHTFKLGCLRLAEACHAAMAASLIPSCFLKQTTGWCFFWVTRGGWTHRLALHSSHTMYAIHVPIHVPIQQPAVWLIRGRRLPWDHACSSNNHRSQSAFVGYHKHALETPTQNPCTLPNMMHTPNPSVAGDYQCLGKDHILPSIRSMHLHE